jgi:hypothetical protein
LTEPTHSLIQVFEKQFAFSRTYSPLYAALFATVAGWLAQGSSHPVNNWLVKAASGRRPLDVTLLLAAGVHRDVLLGEPEASILARYYPSVGGDRSPYRSREDESGIDPAYRHALRLAIMGRQDILADFIQNQQVQTNETGRGYAWLLPVAAAGWPHLHLIDVGASAGLNLLADQRRYDFIDGRTQDVALRLGAGAGQQFTVQSGPEIATFSAERLPAILSRLGCDQQPFRLHSPLDEATLTAFTWADQPERIQRLREAIKVLREAQGGPVPVQIGAAELPEGLPSFLAGLQLQGNEPVVCYNTYIRMYLRDKGTALREHIAEWAAGQRRLVVWVQWEPASCTNINHGRAPAFGWLAWTIDVWQRSHLAHWHIAWVHPHGQTVQWLPDLARWQSWTRSLPSAKD